MASSPAKAPGKATAASTVQPVTTSTSDEENGPPRRPDRDVRAAIYAIVTGVALPCVPILIILAVLLYFIYHKRVIPWQGFAELRTEATVQVATGPYAFITDWRRDGGKAAYLVDFNPSTLTTIASWTSRVIPYLTGSIMSLVAFFAARYIVAQSDKGDDAVLPDPEQLTLLIGLLGGSGVTPLKDTAFYRWLKKEKLTDPVPAAFWALMFITVLGFLIPVVDTWFGIATHPIAITIISNTTAPQQYGRTLNTAVCPDGPNAPKSGDAWPPGSEGIFWPCGVDTNFYYAPPPLLPFNLSDVTKLLYNLPTHTTISNHTQKSTNWYFFSDPLANSSLDFLANTPAISTECVPVSQQCSTGAFSSDFSCTPSFRGNFSRAWPYVMDSAANLSSEAVYGTVDSTSDASQAIIFGTDAALGNIPPLLSLEVGSINYTWPAVLPQNPSTFVTWSSDLPSSDFVNSINSSLKDDAEFLGPSPYSLYFLRCSATVANLTYAYASGNLTSFNPAMASAEMNALLTSHWTISGANTGTSTYRRMTNGILTDMATAAGVSANNMTELASLWSDSYSRAALALSLGAFRPEANILEQHRNSTVIVARVPLVPLYLLVGVKLIYVVAVIILAIGAYAFTHPAETELVKSQLSTKGLAAAHFDQPDLLQQNAVKAVEARLQGMHKGQRSNTEPAKQAAAANDPAVGGLKRSDTSPALIDGGRPRVGLVPNAEGAWKFMVIANGVWHSIEPVVKTLVVTQAKQGGLGAAGGVVNAWKGS